MPIFALITILPCLLVGLAAFAGGAWAFGPVIYMTLLVTMMDLLIAANTDNADTEAEFPASETLLIGLGLAHFCVLGMAIWGVAGPSGLDLAERLALGAGAGLIFGQISHPVAHELIHKQTPMMRWLGQWMYTTLLAGHHASAHLLIHHIHVGSDTDPNSAPRGENFYRYMARVTRQSFLTAMTLETQRSRRAEKPIIRHPFILYIVGGLATLIAVFMAFEWIGVLAFLSIALHAQIQILMFDYVQHYGLRRARLANGRLEPVGPHHSWNAPDAFSSFLMVNAPRHSDHPVSPHRDYPALQLDPEEMPKLPYPLPIMGVIALFPKLWFGLMNPLCDAWTSDRADLGKSRPKERKVGRKISGQAQAHLAQSTHAQNVTS